MSTEESPEHGRIALAWKYHMRIWGSQRLILLLQVLCQLFLFRCPECTPSSVNRGLDTVRINVENVISMGESHEHGRIACAYRGVSGVTFCIIGHSSASGSS